jgi:hypothetical protein
MAPPSLRGSDRISVTLLLEVSGIDGHGKQFQEPARTLLINRGGAVIVLERELVPEQQIHLRRKTPSEAHRQGSARVVREVARGKEGYLYGVAILGSEIDLWGVGFPPMAESAGAVAKMLLECSHCRAREVVYVNELELRAFETNRGIARQCTTCGVPSVWTQASHEDEKKLAARAARSRRTVDAQDSVPSGGDRRERRRIRLQTRLTACIRQAGTDDELAVCEDISPTGLCFRSKRRYDADTVVDVAVPYSPEAGNIFLPARVVFSEELPKAGLFRHGTEYRGAAPRQER